MSGSDRPTAISRLADFTAHSALRLYLAFALFAILPMAIFSIYADRTFARQNEAESQAENVQIANLSANLVEEHFRQNTTLLRSVARDEDFLQAWRKRDMAVIEQHMQEAHLLQPDSSLVSTYELNGTMNSIAPLDPSVIGKNYTYRDWYKGLATSWRPYVSEVYRITAAPHTLAVAIAVPIEDEDGPSGIIAAAYSLERVSGWLKPAEAHNFRAIRVIDQRGKLVAAADINVNSPPVDFSRSAPVQRLLKGESGTMIFDDGTGNKQFAAYVPIPSLHWGILVEQPQADVLQAVRATRYRTLALGLLLVGLTIFSGRMIAAMYRRQQALSERVNSLAMSEQRYRSLIEGATLGIYRSDDTGFVSANPAMVQMLGYSSEEELLRLDPERDLYVDPEVRSKLIHDYRSTDLVNSVEVQWKRKDGKPITVRLSGRSVSDAEGKRSNLFEMIAEDVTERHTLEQQLRQSQKMEAVGRLAGGIAHDFNNLLTVISGYNGLIHDMLEAQHPAQNELNEVKRATDRAAALTRQLLAFSRHQVLEPKVLELNHIVTGMGTLLRKLLGEDIDLVTKLSPGLFPIKADSGQLGQVIMNLAVNARDAMPRGGLLTIETTNTHLDESYANEHLSVVPGDYVMLAVSDNGVGMDEATRARIFEPFFTTKAAGKGTGLGLSTVYGVVQQSGGYIWVYSEVGIGTTFKIYLPRSKDTQRAASTPAVRPDVHARPGERVLIVEDEEAVRSLAAILLRRHGYDVLEAAGPDAALERVKECSAAGQSISLLLTDVVLRSLSGRDLAEKVTELSPETRVLYMSGYTDDAVLRHGVLSASAFFLQKPFSADGLARKVRDVLDSPVTPSQTRA